MFGWLLRCDSLERLFELRSTVVDANADNPAYRRDAFVIALLTYLFWGVAPVYFKWLDHLAPTIIIAHRVIWGLGFLGLFLAWRDGWSWWRRLRLPRNTVLTLMLSGALVATNWLIFVWAVTHEQILATSLGYFINPLINVFLGMLFLGEKLRGGQWVALALATISTLYMAFFVGESPWIALSLAFSFGFYGLVRKKLGVRPLLGLFWETLLLTPIALIYLLIFAPDGELIALDWWLLVGAGLVTILPLIGFNFAAQRLSLTVIGFMQYIAPTISFLIAIFYYHEPFAPQLAIVFGGIWLALIVFTLSSRRVRPIPAQG